MASSSEPMISKAGQAARDRLAQDELTPMMRQYLTVKAEHPNAIVLFRMGDFFETFFEDAQECARILDITLTARSKEKDIPMAGVPHHAIDGYLARLIAAGCTAVMVDQVEDPKQAKGLVRREITRILSPGTYLDPHAPGRNLTYLTALSIDVGPRQRKLRESDPWGLASIDVSTGEFRVTSGVGPDLLRGEIARIAPRELLVSDARHAHPLLALVRSADNGAVMTSVDAAFFEAKGATEALSRNLSAIEVTAAQTVIEPAALRAAGAALGFVENGHIRAEAPDLRGTASLKHIRRITPYLPGDALALDGEARGHLELFRSAAGHGPEGTLLGAIDRAVTPMGGRLLSRWLAYPERTRERIESRLDAVDALFSNATARDAIRKALANVGDLDRLLARVVMGRAVPTDLRALRRTLQVAPSVLGALEKLQGSTLLTEHQKVDVAADVADLLERALVDEPSNDLAGGDVFRTGYDAELDRVVQLSTEGKALIAALESREREATGIGNLKVRYNRVFGYFIEVTKSQLASVPDRYVRKQTMVNAERYFTDELKALETDVLGAADERAVRTAQLFEEVIERIADQAARLNVLSTTIATIDLFAGLAHLAARQSWVRPIIEDSQELDIREGRHPVIEQLSLELGERFVPNDLKMGLDERLMIITGPNMAGKSTIMRQTALIVILAQMGSFVPASSARIGIVDRVFTRVGASDDLARGRSTFMVEMNETARILRSATAASLVLLDEVGRGTSTFDGLSIAWAVAEYLHDRVGCKTLFATHYHELTEICRDKKAAVNRHVAVKEWNDEIVFLRKLLPGPTNRSYGVQVARLAGLPEAVLSRARQVLDSLEAQALQAGDASAVAHLVRQRGHEAGPALDQLHLFAGPVSQPGVDAIDDEVRLRLRAAVLDDMTPREALAFLYELSALVDED